MSTADSYLPPALSAESITALILSLSLPTPTSITPLEVRAAFHSIYLITFAASPTTKIPARPNPDGSTTLVLRVSGRQLPRIKTLNEVGVMTWVRTHTSIPVPAILHHDATETNPIGHEFTLLEKAPGVSLDTIYPTLSEAPKTHLVRQLADYLIELHTHPWTDGYVGGLTLSASGEVAQGPPIDETYWQMPDLEKYWSSSTVPVTSLETLNPTPPDGFTDYVAFTVGCLDRYLHAIDIHPALEPYRDLVRRVRAFREAIQRPENAARLNEVPYVLAHKDLHCANIMCDPTQPGCPITAVLDWEFSGVVAAPRWNPVRAFLWNGREGEENKAERNRLEAVFEEVVRREKGAEWVLAEMKWRSPLQEEVQKVVNHLRAIVEVVPRGQAGERAGLWRTVVEEGMSCVDGGMVD
ncbi:phosphotransferase family protein [Aspergillus aculeatinus CBS 121060]|uniref:APH-domain-containing protein n=1 Tax=Aspergillus aculeatinus CBS 121060 TaxID=1448322 RepID=A0ACD1GSG4_9EURO|nr:APH-domain-containing protein [Aspergillus aculeatinus CBS 121060]RAH64125.1 APH-domain-containing protein [Aspergillus aculeatinus CBS 121060]